MEHLPSNETTYIQHQIDLLRQELENYFINEKLADEESIKNDSAEILHETIRMLEKENQGLKNEIKNQQVVTEMLITNDKWTDEWKTVKTKSKNNTNIASPSSV